MRKAKIVGRNYGSYVAEIKNADSAVLEAYIRAIEAKGYTLSTQNIIADNLFKTYRYGDMSVHAYFLPSAKTVRFAVERCKAPCFTTSLQNKTEPAIFASSVSDRSYFIRLADNTVVIMDGGWRMEDMNAFDRDTLFGGFVNELLSICKTDIIHVSAWFVTHPHLDHANFLEYVHEYGYDSYFKVDRIVRNFPDPSYITPNKWDDPEYIGTLETAFKKWKGAEIITARTGMRFELSGMTFEVYMTPDDTLSEGLENINATSLLIMQSCNGKRILWTGDMTSKVSVKALAMYGDALKCDAVQVSHHGWGGAGKLEFYETCSATVQLWTNSEYGFRFADPKQGYGKTVTATAVYDMPCCIRHIFCNGIKLQKLSLTDDWDFNENKITHNLKT